MKKIDLTVIVPVYNCEKYINDMCAQLNSQTYKDFEVIFVDDCSTDNSYKILKEAEKKYSFIKVFRNKENSGAGYSRNYAIKETTSEYIGFVDCDDFIPDNYFEEMVKAISSKKTDMVLCDIKITYAEGFDTLPSVYNNTCHKVPVSKFDIINNNLSAAAWNKIIKRDVLVNNLFSEGIINEDIPAILGSIIDSEKIDYTNKTYYTYVQRKTSIQNGTKLKKRFDVFKAFDELIERKKDNDILKEVLDVIVYNQLILFLFYGILITDSRNISKFLKLFEDSCDKFNYRENKYYIDFMKKQTGKIKYYYIFVIKLMEWRLFGLANVFINCCKLYPKMRKKFKRSVIKENISLNDLIIMAKKNQTSEEIGKVSVVVPNYNYANFLYQRIYSILLQKVKINELIILDDCSSDNSRTVIDEAYESLKDIISIEKVYNDTNSGSVFKQWEKGFSLAKSDYVWIAEADDYSSSKFLNKVLNKMISSTDVVLGYCDTSYVDVNGVMLNKSVKKLIDIMKTGHWNKDYVNDGVDEIKNYVFLNCTIANVSSVVFKKIDYSKELKEAGSFKQCGDWYFYFSVMKRGKVSYISNAYNICRLHGSNSTTNLKKKIHYQEVIRVQNIISAEFKTRDNSKYYIDNRLKYLKDVWDLSDVD